MIHNMNNMIFDIQISHLIPHAFCLNILASFYCSVEVFGSLLRLSLFLHIFIDITLTLSARAKTVTTSSLLF
jgi:hypothetical protein